MLNQNFVVPSMKNIIVSAFLEFLNEGSGLYSTPAVENRETNRERKREEKIESETRKENKGKKDKETQTGKSNERERI